MQHADYSDVTYQNFRDELIKKVLHQINSLNKELISVKSVLKYVDSFKETSSFVALSELDKENLINHIGKVVYLDEIDEDAKGFDNLIYGLMVSILEKNRNFSGYKNSLMKICEDLLKKSTISLVKDKIPLIKNILSDAFWESIDILTLEDVRRELRPLVNLISEEKMNKIVYTDLKDEITILREGEIDYTASYDFENYKLKVNRYIEENKDNLAIFKLRNNIPMSLGDYENLEYVFTDKLGSKEDYKNAFGDTPFGLLVRSIAKLNQEAANEVFSEFISNEHLNQNQIVFVKKVIDYIVQNGYIDNASVLTKAPFDKPASFVKIFDAGKKKKFLDIINNIKNNAIDIVNI